MSGRGFPFFSPPYSSETLSATHPSTNIAQGMLPSPLQGLPQLRHPITRFLQTTATTPDRSGPQMSIKATESQMLEWPGILIESSRKGAGGVFKKLPR